jgi:hypothetical protein
VPTLGKLACFPSKKISSQLTVIDSNKVKTIIMSSLLVGTAKRLRLHNSAIVYNTTNPDRFCFFVKTKSRLPFAATIALNNSINGITNIDIKID